MTSLRETEGVYNYKESEIPLYTRGKSTTTTTTVTDKTLDVFQPTFLSLQLMSRNVEKYGGKRKGSWKEKKKACVK